MRPEAVCTNVTLANATRTEEPLAVAELDSAVFRALLQRGLLEFGVSLAGVGILAAFATIGAVGLVGQRCAELLPAGSHRRA
jgi:hypothetical protein